MFEDTIPYYKHAFRTLRRIEEDGKNYKREMERQKNTPGSKKQPHIFQNQTLENQMRQKTKGEDWKTFRKKAITEALKRKPTYIKNVKDYIQPRDR